MRACSLSNQQCTFPLYHTAGCEGAGSDCCAALARFCNLLQPVCYHRCQCQCHLVSTTWNLGAMPIHLKPVLTISNHLRILRASHQSWVVNSCIAINDPFIPSVGGLLHATMPPTTTPPQPTPKPFLSSLHLQSATG